MILRKGGSSGYVGAAPDEVGNRLQAYEAGTGDHDPMGVVKRCIGCGDELIRLELDGRLSVHLPGDTPEAHWTSTPLDGFTCVGCGRTDLYAREPQNFRGAANGQPG